MLRWRGRFERREQVANACDSYIDLTPASEAPAEAVKAAWLPLQTGQTIPLIGEDRRYGGEEDDDFC